MPQCPDLPPMDATIQTQTITFDFGPLLANYPEGTALTGTPQVSIAISSGSDADASSRLIGSPEIGTAAAPKGSGIASGAVLQQVGTLQSGCVYVLICTCGITGSTDILPLWVRLPVKTPK